MFFEHREVFLEIICDKMSQIMIAIEDRSDFDKRYKFENIVEVSLKKKRSNSRRFIVYCELNTNDHTKDFDESDDDSQEFTRALMKKT